MTPDVELVLKLQSIDNQIAELEREISSLPAHIAEIEKALVVHQRKLEADKAALAANQKERRKLEGEVQGVEQKVSKLKDQIFEAKTNQQLWAFQHEIQYGEDQIRKAEDRILDLMSDSEPLEANVLSATKALAEESKDVEREKALARKRTEEDRRQLEKLQGERADSVARLNPQIYSTYERIRRKYRGGVAVGEGTSGRCSECNIMLRPQFYQDLRKGGQLIACESCGRLLYYNPTIDVAAELESKEAEA
jgi:predicted  nucleic acid-binding Zn-ribbon protein